MKKTKTTKKARTSAPLKKPVVKETCCVGGVWSWTIYVYWFIILFFIAATFYILGRSHEFLHPSQNRVDVVEEKLMQHNDYLDSAKENLAAGDMDQALTDLTAAIDANATSDSLTLRGEMYLQMGNYQKALDDFNSAIEIDGMNAVAFYDRALLNMRLENYDAALNDINNSLAAQSMKPSDVLSMRNLYAKRGQLNLWLKNWQGAVADYTNSLARAEGSISANVYAERAEAYTAIGEFDNDYCLLSRMIFDLPSAIASIMVQDATETTRYSLLNKSTSFSLLANSILVVYGIFQ